MHSARFLQQNGSSSAPPLVSPLSTATNATGGNATSLALPAHASLNSSSQVTIIVLVVCAVAVAAACIVYRKYCADDDHSAPPPAANL